MHRASCCDEKRTDEAIELLQRGIKLTGASPNEDLTFLKLQYDLNDQLAADYVLTGKLDLSVPYREKAGQIAADLLARDPQDPEVQRIMVRYYSLHGDEMVGRKEIDKALGTDWSSARR
jgi:hypothetical protein